MSVLIMRPPLGQVAQFLTATVAHGGHDRTALDTSTLINVDVGLAGIELLLKEVSRTLRRFTFHCLGNILYNAPHTS